MIQNRPKLLYVEDDTDIMQDIVFLLKEYFSEIITAVDGIEAVEKFSMYRPDIVLLDINIPKLDGIEVAKKIREDDEETPILFLTAYSDRDRLMRAINLGVSSYMVKPLNVAELKSTITKLISKIEQKPGSGLAHGFSFNSENSLLLYQSNEFKLTKNELQLIKFLNDNRQKFLSACDIATELFPQNLKDSKCNNIVQLISRFKSKVMKKFNTEHFFIQNVYGAGYKLY